MMQRQRDTAHSTQRHTQTDTSPGFCFGPFFTLATLPPWSCKAEKSFSLITFKKYCWSLKPILNYSFVDMWLHYGFPKMAIDKLIGHDSSWNSTLIGTRISYTLSREYWVVRSWYSRMLFTGEDRLSAKFARATTIDEYDVTMPEHCGHVTSRKDRPSQ